jgi:hypothetical protein
VIEAPTRVTLEEERWCDESARVFAALAVAEPRITESLDRHELRKLCAFYRKVAAEARSLTAPTVRTEDVRRPLELSAIAFARAADQKTRNFCGVWTRTMREGLSFYEQCRDVYGEFASG